MSSVRRLPLVKSRDTDSDSGDERDQHMKTPETCNPAAGSSIREQTSFARKSSASSPQTTASPVGTGHATPRKLLDAQETRRPVQRQSVDSFRCEDDAKQQHGNGVGIGQATPVAHSPAPPRSSTSIAQASPAPVAPPSSSATAAASVVVVRGSTWSNGRKQQSAQKVTSIASDRLASPSSVVGGGDTMTVRDPSSSSIALTPVHLQAAETAHPSATPTASPSSSVVVVPQASMTEEPPSSSSARSPSQPPPSSEKALTSAESPPCVAPRCDHQARKDDAAPSTQSPVDTAFVFHRDIKDQDTFPHDDVIVRSPAPGLTPRTGQRPSATPARHADPSTAGRRRRPEWNTRPSSPSASTRPVTPSAARWFPSPSVVSANALVAPLVARLEVEQAVHSSHSPTSSRRGLLTQRSTNNIYGRLHAEAKVIAQEKLELHERYHRADELVEVWRQIEDLTFQPNLHRRPDAAFGATTTTSSSQAIHERLYRQGLRKRQASSARQQARKRSPPPMKHGGASLAERVQPGSPKRSQPLHSTPATFESLYKRSTAAADARKTATLHGDPTCSPRGRHAMASTAHATRGTARAA